MADAISAFKEAFDSYKRSLTDYAVYSVVMMFSWMAISFSLLAVIIMLGVVSAGSAVNLAGSAGNLSGAIVGLGATMLVLFLGLLVFSWVAAGLSGAYLETLNMFQSGRKQTFGGFFSAVPKRATVLFSISLVSAICVFIISTLFGFLSSLVGGIPGLAIFAFGTLLSAIISLLFFLAVPAAIVENRGAVSAIKSSFSKVPRNIVGVVLYLIIAAILFFPSLLTVIGVVLFWLPMSQGALLLLYKKSK